MEINNDIQWSDDVENFLKDVGERCSCMAYLHAQAEKVYSNKSMYIDLPVIVLSTISGSLSLSAERVFGKENEKVASIACGILSLGVGVLNTINSYFNYSRQAENCKNCNISYSRIYRFICIQLKLPRIERIAAKDLIRMIQDQYERLSEVGNNIPQSTLMQFRKKFHDTDISKPNIANGLDPIIIHGRNEPIQVVISDTAAQVSRDVIRKGKKNAMSTMSVAKEK